MRDFKKFAYYALPVCLLFPSLGTAESMLSLSAPIAFEAQMQARADSINHPGIKNAHNNVVYNFDEIHIHVDTMMIEPDEEGERLYFSGIDVNGTGRLSWRASLEALSLTINGDTALMPTSPCAWFANLRQAKAEKIHISIFEDLRINIDDLEFVASGIDGSCTIEGALSVSNAGLRGDTNRFQAQNIEVKGRFPLQMDAVTASEDGFSITIDQIDGRRIADRPILGVSNLEFTSRFDEGSFANLIFYTDRLISGFDDRPRNLNLFEAWNIASRTKSHHSLSIGAFRLQTSDIIPATWVRNFTRAGLSTISGSSMVKLKLANDGFAISQAISLNGIADLNVGLTGDMIPYQREQLLGAAREIALGRFAIPGINMRQIDLRYSDTGLSEAALIMTGYSPSTFVNRNSELIEKFGLSPFRREIANFLSEARFGNENKFQIYTSDNFNLLENVYFLITNKGDIVNYINGNF